ncbi:MAG: hypothetical protein M3340_00250 [Actinomycetota bacterium]|nr:hypothetical protein [Actinomycetota bacterium]
MEVLTVLPREQERAGDSFYSRAGVLFTGGAVTSFLGVAVKVSASARSRLRRVARALSFRLPWLRDLVLDAVDRLRGRSELVPPDAC